MRNLLNRIELAAPGALTTLVENRRVFNLANCELNIYESYQQAFRVPLTFNDLVITSMVRGKKIMHLLNKPDFDYLPGESVILPARETMVIDFPDATLESPSQCIALTVDARYAQNTVQYLNEFYHSVKDDVHDWKLQFNKYHFENDEEVTFLINKLLRICASGEREKSIFADLSLKELLIRLLQSQHLEQVKEDSLTHTNRGRLEYVLHYIHQHLADKILVDELCRKAYLARNDFFKWFREQFGTTPVDYINLERVKLAKQLMADDRLNLADISQRCGFCDLNYFVRIFKKIEGVTPGLFRSQMSAFSSCK